jgi:hypothetical protein
MFRYQVMPAIEALETGLGPIGRVCVNFIVETAGGLGRNTESPRMQFASASMSLPIFLLTDAANSL